jgi:aspartate ammonia-lyase
MIETATAMDRTEHDLLGSLDIPDASRYGIHTRRALENFDLLGHPVHPGLARAFGAVKLAAARTNRGLGFLPDPAIADAVERACAELLDGTLAPELVVDALQGGAGTSTNMNVNEVLANRALELLGQPHGAYASVSPTDTINLHQSTNDTFPTALRIAAIWALRDLERAVVALQESSAGRWAPTRKR